MQKNSLRDIYVDIHPTDESHREGQSFNSVSDSQQGEKNTTPRQLLHFRTSCFMTPVKAEADIGFMKKLWFLCISDTVAKFTASPSIFEAFLCSCVASCVHSSGASGPGLRPAFAMLRKGCPSWRPSVALSGPFPPPPQRYHERGRKLFLQPPHARSRCGA